MYNLYEKICKQLDCQLSNDLADDNNIDKSGALEHVFRLEDYIRRLDDGAIKSTNHYNWKMIQLDDDDDEGRKKFQDMYESHINSLEDERQKQVKV